MQQKSVNLSNEHTERLAKRVKNGEIDSLSEGVRESLNNDRYAVDIGKYNYERLREKKEQGEIDSIDGAVREKLNGTNHEASDFREWIDQVGVTAGVLGMVLMALTLFAPAPYRFVSLVPLTMSVFFFGTGYAYDYSGNPVNHD